MMTNRGKRWYCGTSGVALTVAAGVLLHTASAQAQTVGGTVVAGQATITGQGTAQTVVNQSSDRAILDWNRFSLNAGDAAIFRQPDAKSITVNRVTGSDPSTILGSIQANGQVVLINRNGVLFGKGSTVDTAGLIVTSHDIDAAGFMAGDRVLRFDNGGNDAAEIVVEGRISIRDAGMAAFVAPRVRNAGLIQADMGRISLGAGKGFGIDLYGDGLVRFSAGDAINETLKDASGTPLKALVENEGTITARGGRILLTATAAREVVNASVNVGGVVRADSATSQGGVITLSGSGGIITETGSMILASGTSGGAVAVEGGAVGLGGVIDASATGLRQAGGTITVNSGGLLSLGGTTRAASALGSGGSVGYSAARLFENSDGRTDASGLIDGGAIRSVIGGTTMTSGRYTADGIYGAGGRIDLTAMDLRLLSTTISATGRQRGGLVRIGGAFQGGKAADPSKSYTQSFTGRWGALPTLAAAGHSFVNDGTRIDVSASRGDGGTAVIWSDAQTTFLGAIDARGVTADGSVEISSAQDLRHAALDRVTVGKGQLLLDPKNLIIGDVVAQQGWSYIGIMGKGYTPTDVARLEQNDHFGASVALNATATRMAVGAVSDRGVDNATNGAGAVYLFSFTDSNFGGGALEGIIGRGYAGGKNINISGLEQSDAFGQTVSLNADGTRLVVGAPGDMGASNAVINAGAVYLFRFSGTNFSGASTPIIMGSGYSGSNISVSGVGSYDYFGSAVSLNASGDRLVVGVPGDDGQNYTTQSLQYGAAYLFGFSDTNFSGASRIATIGRDYTGGNNINFATLVSNGDFGRSVSLNAAGDRLAVGASAFATAGNAGEQTGAVFLYSFNDTTFGGGSLTAVIGKGQTGGKNINVTGLGRNEFFGSAVALNADGTQLAVGAPYDAGANNSFQYSGYVRLFSFSDGNFSGGVFSTGVGRGTDPNTPSLDVTQIDPYDNFGNSVAFNATGDKLAVGVAGKRGASNADAGSGAVLLFGDVPPSNAGWSTPTYGSNPSDTVTVSATDLAAQLASGAAVTLQASNDITVSRPVSVTPGFATPGALTLQAGRSVLINADITTGGGDVTVIANDWLANGVIDAQRDGGAAAITMAAGSAINAGSGNVTFDMRSGTDKTYFASNDIALSSITGGRISVVNDGPSLGNGVVVLSGAVLTAGASGEAINLVGDRFINSGGTNALVTPAGYWSIWSRTPDNDQVEGLNFEFKQYGATYGQSSIAGTGNGLMYRATAAIGARLGVTSKAYDGTTTARVNGLGATGVLAGDRVILDAAGASFSDANAGLDKTVTATGLYILSASSGGKPVYGYTLIPTSVTNSSSIITPAVLSIGTPSIADKVYDGTTTPGALSIGALSGFVGTETVDVAGAAAALSSRNAGIYTTTVAYTLSDGTNGGRASNYTLAPSTVSAVVTRRPLTVSSLSVSPKVYDGSTMAIVTGGTLTGVLANDDVTRGDINGQFVDKNVGTGKAVTLSSFTLTGTDADNYTLDQPTGLTGTITAREVSLVGRLVASNKAYDGTTAASVDTRFLTIGNGVSGDAVALDYTGATASFADKDVGSDKPVTLSTTGTLTGADAGNYVLVASAPMAAASITPAILSIGTPSIAAKVYDGTTTPGALSIGALSGLVGAETLGVEGVAAALSNRNVGTYRTSVAYTLSDGTNGGLASNYLLASSTGVSAAIVAKGLTMADMLVATRTYDGTAAASLRGGRLVGVVSGEDVRVDAGVGQFADKNVGTDKAVTASGFTLWGGDAGNYTLAQPSGLTGTITARQLSLTGQLVAGDKVYDGTTAASVDTGGLTLVNGVSGDAVALDYTGATASFADKDVGAGKTVTLSTAGTLTGADAGNYLFVATAPTATANISPATLSIGTPSIADKAYDGTTAPGALSIGALSGLVGAETLGVEGVAAALSGRNVGTYMTSVAYTLSDSANGDLASNYVLAPSSGVSAAIVAKALTIADMLVATRTYDGTTAASFRGGRLVGVVSGEDVRIEAGVGQFADRNVGVDKPVTASGFALWGGDAGNYMLAQPTGLTGTITALSVSLGGTLLARDKVYDAGTAALVDTSGLSLTGILAGDTVALSYAGATGSFADKNVGTGKTVTLSTLGVLIGTDAGNYRIAGSAPTATASITPATLRIGNLTVGSKAYDGNTVAPMLGGSVVGLGQDAVALVTSGVNARFADKNVGNGKAVTVTGYTLSGIDAGNYTLVQPTGLSGTITRARGRYGEPERRRRQLRHQECRLRQDGERVWHGADGHGCQQLFGQCDDLGTGRRGHGQGADRQHQCAEQDL